MNGFNEIICGDALEVLKTLPDKSCRTCITSPPYYGLRNYGIKGQIGLENSLAVYIKKLVAVFLEVRRVLTDDGTLWLNLGDCYAYSGKGWGGKDKSSKQITNAGSYVYQGRFDVKDLPPKNLLMVPARVAIALQETGKFILRNDCIWAKSNPMPESVKDRCTLSHEHFFFFAKQQNYFYDEVGFMEPAVGSNDYPPAGSLGAPNGLQSRRRVSGNKERKRQPQSLIKGNISVPYEQKQLRHKRDVWICAKSSSRKKHFATFPEALIRPCLLSSSAPGDVVIDPFCGSGTVCKAANDFGRKYIGIDISKEYCELSRSNITTNLFRSI